MAEVSTDGRLNWRSTLDNSDFKAKTEENIRLIRLMLEAAGDTEGIKAFDAAMEQSRRTEAAALESTTAKIREQTKAIEKMASVAAKPIVIKTEVSNTQAEVDAFKSSMSPEVGGSDTYAGSGRQKLIDLQNESLQRLSEQTAIYNDQLASGAITQQEYDDLIAKHNLLIQAEADELTRLTTAEAEEAEVSQASAATKREQIGLIQTLINKVRELKAQQAAVPANESDSTLPALNAQLEATQLQLSQLKNVGKAGFDELGNAIERPIGQVNRLKYALAAYKDMAASSTNPDIITKYNAKIQDTQQEISRLSNVGKQGFDSLGNKIDDASNKTAGFGSQLASIAKFTGIAILIGLFTKLISTVAELVKETDSVDRAFAKLGDTDLLSNLQKQTDGLIDNLDLEKYANKASKLNIPLDDLGKLLLFAQRQAEDLGISADEATNKIIDGIGRKSVKSFEALGIRTEDLQKSVKLTGNFYDGLMNIINNRTDEAGTHVDTFTDKFQKGLTKIKNSLEVVAKFIRESLFPDLVDNDQVEKYVAANNKALSASFAKTSQQGRANQIQNQIALVKKLSDEYDKLNSGFVVDRSSSKTIAEQEKAYDDIKKTTAERFVAAQTTLSDMQKQNNELNTTARKTKEILSDEELREEIQKKRTDASVITFNNEDTDSENLANKKKHDDLIKQADDLQKELDIRTGKQAKKDEKAADAAAKRQAREDAASLRAKQNLLQQVSDLEDSYSRKQLTEDDEEIQKVNDRFKEIANRIKDFNSDPRNKNNQIDAGILEPARKEAVYNTQQDLDFQKTKISIDAQKELFKEYQQYKIEVGTKTADEVYSNDLKGYTDFVSYLQSLTPESYDFSKQANLMRDYLKTAIPAAKKEQQKQNSEILVGILADTLDFEQRRQAITEKYAKLIGIADAAGFKDRSAMLTLQMQSELSDLNLNQEKEVASYRDFYKDIENLTVEAATIRVKEAQNTADKERAAGKLSKESYEEITKYIQLAAQNIKAAGISKSLSDIASFFTQIGSSTGGIDKGLSSTFTSIGNLFTQTSGFVKNISTLKDLLANFKQTQTADGGGLLGTLGAVGGIASTVAGLFGAAFSIIGGINASAEKAKQEQIKAEQYAYGLQVKAIDAVNKSLERQLELTKQIYGTKRIDDYKKQLTDITKAEADAQASLAGKLTLSGDARLDDIITRKNAGGSLNGFENYEYTQGLIAKLKSLGLVSDLAGKSVEELQTLLDKGEIDEQTGKIVQDLIDLKQQYQDTMNALNEDVVGQSFDSLLDSVDSLFDNFTTSAQDFGDNFEDIMRKSILNSFKRQYLEAQLQQFYNELAQDATAGTLTTAQIDALRAEYDKITGDAKAALDKISSATGIDFSSDSTSANSLKGGIEAMTEQTADVIAGQLGGLRLEQVETNAILKNNNTDFLAFAKQNLSLAQQIADNTKRGADNTDSLPATIGAMKDSLVSIDKTLKSGSGSLAASGKGV